MRDKLRIRFVVFEGALAMQILSQPEEWRKEERFTASNGAEVAVSRQPQIFEDGIFLRGSRVDEDLDIAVRRCVNPSAFRDKLVAAITEFVVMKDGKKSVDVSWLVGTLRTIKVCGCSDRNLFSTTKSESIIVEFLRLSNGSSNGRKPPRSPCPTRRACMSGEARPAKKRRVRG